MKCNNCGAEISDEARFCEKCGAPVSSDAAPAPAAGEAIPAPKPLEQPLCRCRSLCAHGSRAARNASLHEGAEAL